MVVHQTSNIFIYVLFSLVLTYYNTLVIFINIKWKDFSYTYN